MKKAFLLSILISSLTCFYTNGQVADGITYQAVALDEKGKEIPGADINGKIIHSRAIGVRFSIIESAYSNDILYQETHQTHTDHNGLFSVVIGHGDPTGEGRHTRLTDIQWGASPLFLKVEMDIRNQGNYKLMGIQQMMAVPFAFHALNSSNTDNIEETDPLFTAWDKSTGIEITESQITDLKDYITNESDPLFQAWDKSEGINISENQIYDLQNYLTSINSQSIGDLADVELTGLTNGMVLQFDQELNKWTVTESEGVGVETDPIFTAWDRSTGIVISENQISDLGNYLTNETDPLFTAWDKSTGIEITESQITDLQDYLTNENDPLFSAWDKSTGIVISEGQISDLGNYLTNETDPLFNAWDKSTGIEIIESQITDLQDYLTNENDPFFTSNFNLSGAAPGDLLQFDGEKWVRVTPQFLSYESDPLFVNSKAYNISNAGSGIVITSEERDKLLGIENGAEKNVQVDWNETISDSATYIKNKPVLAYVATSGEFGDLLNKPTTISGYGITDAVSNQIVQSGSLIFGISTGDNNMYEVNITPEIIAYLPGMVINFKAVFDNSGASYLKINNLEPVEILKNINSPLSANDILTDQIVSVLFDGSHFRLMSVPNLIYYSNPSESNHGTATINNVGYTEFTVPPGVRRLFVKIHGSSGGRNQLLRTYNTNRSAGGIPGGRGGYVYAELSVVPGEILHFFNGASGNHICTTVWLYENSIACNSQVNGQTGSNGQASYVRRHNSSEKIINVNPGTRATAPYIRRSGSTCGNITTFNGTSTNGNVSILPGNGVIPIETITGGGVNNSSHCTSPQNGRIIIEW